MAKTYLDSGDTFIVANNNSTVFGAAGTESVTIQAGVTGTVLDQNTESVLFNGAVSAFTFQQTGNQINVYSGATLVAKFPVQGDANGTLLTFTDGTVSAKLTAGVLQFGGTAVSSTAPAAVVPTTIDTSVVTPGGVVVPPTPTFSVTGAAAVAEGASATFTVTLSAAQATATTVAYTLAGTGGATLGTDTGVNAPAGNTGTLTFAAGATTATVVVPFTADAISPEAGEGVSLTLSAPSTGTAVSTTAGTATTAITDVPVTYTLTASAASVFEGVAITYTLTASAASTTATSIDFSVVPGDATAVNQGTSNTNLNDFAAGAFNPSTVVMAAGATTATYVVTSATDALTELPENYSVKAVVGTTTVATKTTSLLDGGGTGPGTVGTTFTLTAGADTLDPNSATAASKTSAGDDLLRAPTDGFLTSADYIDGGAGNDTLTAAITANTQTIAPTLKSVENVTLTVTAADTKALTVNAADFTGTTTVSIKDAGAHSKTGNDEAVTVSNLAKTTTLGIIGGTASTGATSSNIFATFTGVLAADTQKVAISSLGKVGELTLVTAETVEITATGTGATGANNIGSLVAGAVKTLNLKGAGDLTIAASDMAAVVTVDASTSTGVINFTGEAAATSTTFKGGTGATTFASASTGTITVTTGAGADTVTIGASTAAINTGAGNDNVNVGASTNVTAADVIVGGDGIDTITVSDATINATTKTTLALGVSGFEVLATTAAAEVSIDFNALSTYDVVTIATASTPSVAGAAGTAGAAAVAAIMESTADQLIIAAARTGQVGAVSATAAPVTTSGAGGDGITVTPKLDAGANIATLKFIGNADITGGAGGAAATQTAAEADAGGAGGVGLNASTIETLNIEVSGTNATGVTADTVTFTGGVGGAVSGAGSVAGAAGSTVVVGTNGTINLTSSLTGATATVNNAIDLGTVVGTNVTINGAAFKGAITVTAATGNVTILGGEGKDVLTGGAGKDTINGGAGADTLNGMADADVYTGGTGRDSFAISNSGTGAGAFDTVADFGKVTTALTLTQVGTLSTTNAFGAAIATATTLGGDATDALLFAATATFATAAAATDVATASVNAGKAITASISAKGVVTLAGADAALVDTLAEWVGVVNAMAGTNGNVGIFELAGNTYAFQQAGATDTMVQLIGVTGVTGGVVIGAGVAAAVGDIFVA